MAQEAGAAALRGAAAVAGAALAMTEGSDLGKPATPMHINLTDVSRRDNYAVCNESAAARNMLL